MKQLALAAALIVTATSAALAQPVYSPRGYDYDFYGYYDAAPGYGYAVPGYYGYYDAAPQWGDAYRPRGGPGPRVGAGTGLGIGAER